MPQRTSREGMGGVDNLLKLQLKKAQKNQENCTNMGRLLTKFVADRSGRSSLGPEGLENIRDFKILVPWHRSC